MSRYHPIPEFRPDGGYHRAGNAAATRGAHHE